MLAGQTLGLYIPKTNLFQNSTRRRSQEKTGEEEKRKTNLVDDLEGASLLVVSVDEEAPELGQQLQDAPPVDFSLAQLLLDDAAAQTLALRGPNRQTGKNKKNHNET